MKLFTFKKGIHPHYNKSLTENSEIESYFPKEDLIFPMTQHIGAPCKPIVKVGEKVLVGQKIGQGDGFISSNIFSSVSGTVKAIEPKEIASGDKVLSIIVENDNNYNEISNLNKKTDYSQLSNEEIINIIKDLGLVGLGGACFPVHVKLSPPADKPIDKIIINGAECEPYLTCDHRLMLEHTDEIIEGIKILLKLFPKAIAYIGVENNKRNAISILQQRTKNINNIKVVPLKTKYPQGSEKHLIYSITKKQVPSGKLPSEVGCLVQNVTTAYQIYHAVVNGYPQLESIITVTGSALNTQKNIRVKTGTSFNEIIEYCGGFKTPPIKIISGGPMMGISIKTLDIPIVKGTSGILCLDSSNKLEEESQCIRCGRCIESCPMDLLPATLSNLSDSNKLDEFTKYNGLDCIQCGCCAYSCPAKNDLVGKINKAKVKVIRNNKKFK